MPTVSLVHRPVPALLSGSVSHSECGASRVSSMQLGTGHLVDSLVSLLVELTLRKQDLVDSTVIVAGHGKLDSATTSGNGYSKRQDET